MMEEPEAKPLDIAALLGPPDTRKQPLMELTPDDIPDESEEDDDEPTE